MEYIVFYIIAILILVVSTLKNKSKTKMALKKTWKGIKKLLPQMSFILLLVGFSLTVLSPEFISSLIGDSSGILGIVISILVGAVAFLPSFIAFPLGATLLEQGAGLVQVGGFVSTLMGIGIITFGMEKKFFGTHFAVYRNIGALLMTIVFITALSLLTGVIL